MEIKPSKGIKVVVNAQREAVFGDESVSIRKISLNDGLKVGEMTGLTLAGFCEVEMPKLDGKKHWYPIGDLVGENGEAVAEASLQLPQLGEDVEAVDSAVGPEVEEDHPAAQLTQ
jgi:hypothetical protein